MMVRRLLIGNGGPWECSGLVAAAACGVLLTLGGRVEAQPRQEAGDGHAHGLDEEGTRLMDEARYAEACPKLEQSARAAPGTGVLLRLALCFEKLGKTASAWRTYGEAQQLAQITGQQEVAALAARRAAQLAGTLPRLQVRVPDVAAAQATVLLDGEPIAEAVWRERIAVDPGTHEVRVTAPGQRPFVTEFQASAASEVVVAVQFVADRPRPRRGEPAAQQPTSTPVRVERVEESWTVRHTATVTAHGIGLSGLIVGSVFGLSALANMQEAHGRCPQRTGCSEEALRLQEEAEEDARWSTIGFAAGTGGVIAGAILWWALPDAQPTADTSWTVAPNLGAGLGGVVARRSW